LCGQQWPATSRYALWIGVQRQFHADRPSQLWVLDFTYVSTWQGWLYVAFVIDVFARRIVGWRVSTSMKTDFVLDALEQALYARQPHCTGGLIDHSDRGSPYVSIRYLNETAFTKAEAIHSSRCQVIGWLSFCTIRGREVPPLPVAPKRRRHQGFPLIRWTKFSEAARHLGN
jgi:hypothetical protein